MSEASIVGGIDHYVDKWLAGQPQQRMALVFVSPERYPGHVALAALEYELLGAAYGIREPQVAVAKLGWWAEELAGAPQTGGRHPLTQLLFDDPRASRIDGSRWLAPVSAAMAQLEQGTASDFPGQLDAALSLHGALAALETDWWYGPSASAERAGRLAALGHLLDALRRLQDDAERDRLPLPMARLARHGLSRTGLGQASPARSEAIRTQLADLQQAWVEAQRLPGPLSVFRAVAARQDARLSQRAQQTRDPLPVLQAGAPVRGFGLAMAAWRAARRWQAITGGQQARS